MDIINLLANASQHIIMCRPSDMEPQGFGSGCFIQYKDRRLLLSAAHVTDYDGLATTDKQLIDWVRKENIRAPSL